MPANPHFPPKCLYNFLFFLHLVRWQLLVERNHQLKIYSEPTAKKNMQQILKDGQAKITKKKKKRRVTFFKNFP